MSSAPRMALWAALTKRCSHQAMVMPMRREAYFWARGSHLWYSAGVTFWTMGSRNCAALQGEEEEEDWWCQK